MLKKLTFLVLLLFCIASAGATTYYVDNVSGSNTNDGLSPANAWQHMPWDDNADGTADDYDGTLNDGDILALAPGVTYTYTGSAGIEINGEGNGDPDGSRLIIDGSAAAWGSGIGTAILTATSLTTWEGLFEMKAGSNDYITIRYVTIQNISTGLALDLEAGATESIEYVKLEHIVIDNCDGVYGAYIKDDGGTITNLLLDDVEIKNCAGTGIRMDGAGTGLIVKNSSFHDNGAQTGGANNDDGIFIGDTTGFVVQDSYAYDNEDGAGSGSGFDTSYSASAIGGTYERCYSYNNNNANFSASSTNPGDTVTYINCVAYGASDWGNYVFYEGITANVYNCTSGSCSGMVAYKWIDAGTGGTIKNSIAWGTFTYAIELDTGTLTSNYNCLGTGTSTYVANVNGVDKDWAGWQALGHDANGINSDPLFVASPPLPNVNYYKIQTTSPCKDKGDDLSAQGYSNDYDKVTRPQGVKWDIGAFEFFPESVSSAVRRFMRGGVQLQSLLLTNPIQVFDDGETLPAVSSGNVFKADNSGSTTITSFQGGIDSQIIFIMFTNTNTTINETGNIKLSAAFTSTADDILVFVFDGTSWYEVARSLN